MMQKLQYLVLGLALATAIPLAAQVTPTKTWASRERLTATDLNSTFSNLGDGALNRTGGAMTGTLTVRDVVPAASNTYDVGSPSTRVRNVYVAGTVTNSSTGAGSITTSGGITAGSGAVGIVGTDGKIPALSSAYFNNISGSNIGFSFATPSYSAGNFTGSGAMTWTVDSGDVLANNYVVFGNVVLWDLTILSSSVGGTRTAELRATLPGGFTAQNTMGGACAATEDNVGTVPALWQVLNGTTYMSIYRDSGAATAWAAATNTTTIRCFVMFGK